METFPLDFNFRFQPYELGTVSITDVHPIYSSLCLTILPPAYRLNVLYLFASPLSFKQPVMRLVVNTHRMLLYRGPLLPYFSHHMPLSVRIIALSIFLRGSQDMRWKINQSELCVHSALSGETRTGGGLTQSPATMPLSVHLKAMRSVENCTRPVFPYLQIHTHLRVLRRLFRSLITKYDASIGLYRGGQSGQI